MESTAMEPIPMFLTCPCCRARHVDEGEFATKAHHTHSCQACGLTWRPAVVPTVGVLFLPGFKSSEIGVVMPAKGYVQVGDQRVEVAAGDVLRPTFDERGNLIGLQIGMP